jgi:23S rRNA (adenine2503-C2)-methyltransferase
MGCRFCATARIGLRGHLSAAHIVDQVNHVTHEGNVIHNIVYMGMGEPLDNLDAVLRSIRILKNKHGRNLGQRHITVSTCGLPEGMIRLAEEEPQVRLAVSLHAPNDELRTRLMPINRRHSVSDVFKAVRECQAITGRRVTFEYCLMRGVNDQITQAQALVKKLRGIKAHVNLIQFNEFPGCVFKDAEGTTGRQFAQILQEAGIETVIRYTRGRQIKAACGQLGATWSPSSKKPTRARGV